MCAMMDMLPYSFCFYIAKHFTGYMYTSGRPGLGSEVILFEKKKTFENIYIRIMVVHMYSNSPYDLEITR